MGRKKERTTALLPKYITQLTRWGLGGNLREAKRVLKLHWLPDQDFYRIIRGDEATDDEVTRVGDAIKLFGKTHNYQGWEEL